MSTAIHRQVSQLNSLGQKSISTNILYLRSIPHYLILVQTSCESLTNQFCISLSFVSEIMHKLQNVYAKGKEWTYH